MPFSRNAPLVFKGSEILHAFPYGDCFSRNSPQKAEVLLQSKKKEVS